ncbi:hypothetical protein IEQ34_009262 [Dendrobium chrysotoxum]|uniref:Uncharacterized protein n=1 Tax=Dendrobium chrysotoxum TaxID=161865 RepID=A0AAV7H1K6_DENCH|nr:hypothetical protein IEQ34_009262 [Dendrobium chrysotoxum]
MEERRLPGIIEAKEEDLRLLLPQPERGDDAVRTNQSKHGGSTGSGWIAADGWASVSDLGLV